MMKSWLVGVTYLGGGVNHLEKGRGCKDPTVDMSGGAMQAIAARALDAIRRANG